VDDERLMCEVSITVPLDCPKLLMRELVEKAAADTIMRGVPGDLPHCCDRPQRVAFFRAFLFGCGKAVLLVAALGFGAMLRWGMVVSTAILQHTLFGPTSCIPAQQPCTILHVCLTLALPPPTTVVWRAGVSKSYTLEAAADGRQVLQTDGINVRGVWACQVRTAGTLLTQHGSIVPTNCCRGTSIASALLGWSRGGWRGGGEQSLTRQGQ
jgi:hypothetical protein